MATLATKQRADERMGRTRPAALEHVNVTVSDPDRTARMLRDLFGWHLRWSGPAMADGYTVHVGTKTAYVALYTNPEVQPAAGGNYGRAGGLNHIAVTVEDLDAADERVRAAGFETKNHADYEPGRRFYFHDHDGIEYEVVSYT